MRVYRVVAHEEPTVEDFFSNAALKMTPRRPLSARLQRLWEGVSVFETLAAALQLATLSPEKGAYVAEPDLPETAAIERSGMAHHYTVWASPESLRAAVVAVHQVERPERR